MTLAALTTPTVSYDSVSLQTTDYKIESVLDSLHSLPARSISSFPVARSNKSIITSSEYNARTITLVGFIDDTTSEASLQGKVDTLKSIAAVGKMNKNLDIEYAGGTRRFLATVSDIQIKKDVSSLYRFTIQFLCSNPFGYATSQTSVSNAAVTTSPKSIVTVITGTAPPFDATITIEVNTETDLTEIVVQNTNNGDEFTITRAFTAGDIIIAAFSSKTILVNGSEFDYVGIVPEFESGSNTWTVTSTSTAHDIDITLDYSPTYL